MVKIMKVLFYVIAFIVNIFIFSGIVMPAIVSSDKMPTPVIVLTVACLLFAFFLIMFYITDRLYELRKHRDRR